MLKENRSLDRGLLVLQTLAQHSALSLSDIHRATELPKSTLRRLLATLVARRFVRRSISDKLYRIAITLPDFSTQPVPPSLSIVADISLKHVLDLTKAVAWPSDIHVLHQHSLQIVETTRTVSPFSLFKVPVDIHINLFGSATGAACLSKMKEARVRELFEDDSAEASLRPSHYNLSWDALQEHLHKVREQGFGERLPNFRGQTVVDDRLSAMALPLHNEHELCGAISLLWPRNYMAPSDFAELFLQALSNTVSKVESDLQRFAHRQADFKVEPLQRVAAKSSPSSETVVERNPQRSYNNS